MSDVVVDKAPNETFLTAEQMAARWPVPVTKGQIYRMAREGKFAGVVTKVGRYYTWRLDLVEAWEARGGTTEEAA